METLVFGGALQRARVAQLDAILEPQRALVIGEGDGRFLVEFQRRFPRTAVDCIDGSARMIALARGRIETANPTAAGRVRFSRIDLDDWQPTTSGAYDLIVTHFILDCFDAAALAQLIQKLSLAAAPKAVWLVADFCQPTGKLRRMFAAVFLRLMYAFFRYATGIKTAALLDPSPLLGAGGFRCMQRAVSWQGFLKSELWVR